MLQSNQKIIRHKVGLLNLAEELGNVSKACQVMGLSRDTFYRDRDAVEEGGVAALLERTRRVPNQKNRVDLEMEEAVAAYAVEYPAHGQVRVSNELRKCGVFVSPGGVRGIWLRHDLAHFKARLKALEAKVAEEGIILTGAQIQALESSASFCLRISSITAVFMPARCSCANGLPASTASSCFSSPTNTTRGIPSAFEIRRRSRAWTVGASEPSSTTSTVLANAARISRAPLRVSRPTAMPALRARSRCRASLWTPDSVPRVRAADAEGARPTVLKGRDAHGEKSTRQGPPRRSSGVFGFSSHVANLTQSQLRVRR